MKRLCFILFFCLAMGGVFSTHAATAPKTGLILASQDVTLALGQVLVKGTSLKMARAIPAAYSLSVHENYLKKHFQEFSELAQKADVALTVASAWPVEPLFAYARRANPWVVEVDAVMPLDRCRAGVPLLQAPERKALLPYVWRSPGNLARMADIAAADLSRLYPGQAERIINNLNALKRAIFKLRTEYETALAESEYFEVAALTHDFAYLTDEFGISVVKWFLKPEYQWQAKDLNRLAGLLEENKIKAVVCAWQPKAKIAQTIQQAGARILLLNSFKLEQEAEVSVLINYYRQNLEILRQGLAR